MTEPDVTPEDIRDSEEREIPLTTDADQLNDDEDLDPTQGEGGAG